ncbi:hypothetical protein [Nibricoccus aquaticus]|uniref:hypothetical protein n=1 Tax=Nibricoccus aquaticus TaxID=2576891 RepID=UPI0010FF2BAA|nr:hypothetical protein [Nibricoccus aquaticus]
MIATVLVVVAISSFWLGRATTMRNQLAPVSAASSGVAVAELTRLGISRTQVSEDSSSSTRAWEENNWRQLLARPASRTRNQQLAQMLTALAKTEPDRAMQLAQAEKNLVLREALIQSALSGWGATAPRDAAMWVCALDDQAKRSTAMETVFASAAASLPDEAVKLGRELFSQHPDAATGYGCSLVDALCAAGNFETAVALAIHPGALEATGRSILLAKAYSAWATMQPEEAGRAACALPDPAERSEALHAVIGGWGQVDPAGLTQFVARLPAGPDRISQMGQALRAWSQVDAAAASHWVKTNDIGPGLDDGVAAMAGAGFLEPKEAAGWVSDIASPVLRSQTLLTVLRNWANTDPDAARKHFENTRDLLPADRALAASLLAHPGGL